MIQAMLFTLAFTVGWAVLPPAHGGGRALRNSLAGQGVGEQKRGDKQLGHDGATRVTREGSVSVVS